MALSYRAKQFARTFGRGVPRRQLAAALQQLTPNERRLVGRLRPVDQRHSLAVYAAARAAAPDDRVLWVAALLHDVGKGRPGRIDRVMLTLLETSAPWLLIRWRRHPPSSRRGRVSGLVAHTEASAQLAELAGSAPEVVQTIRAYGHRDHARGRLLAELDSKR
ncbi:MAG: HD domain-containing protein [Chloroflexi bacterium]|nr:HD domain-containing protein [Chloroflexota bacterium]